MSRLALLTAALFLLTALSGCITSDDAPQLDEAEEDTAPEAKATASLGSLEGQVVSKDLLQLEGAQVTLIKAEQTIKEATTDEDGNYVMNKLEPGDYFVRIGAETYKTATKPVTITANEVAEVNIVLPALSDAEQGVPTVETRTMKGFYSCGFATVVVAWATCSTLGDPNNKFLFEHELYPGAQEVVVGMTWDPVGGVSGTEFSINMEKEGCGVTCGDNQTYYELAGPPDLVFSVDDEYLDSLTDPAFDEALKLRSIEDNMTFQFRVFPAYTEANVVYQQPFSIYIEVYYFQDAPEGRNPIPDL